MTGHSFSFFGRGLEQMDGSDDLLLQPTKRVLQRPTPIKAIGVRGITICLPFNRFMIQLGPTILMRVGP